MSTYHQIWWLPLCGGLTGLGLVLSYLTMRRRGLGAGVRGAAWSLLPLAAYLTGSTKMFWTIGVAIGDYAKGFAFSPRVWSGIALAGLAVVLFAGSGGLRRRRRVKAAKGAGSAATATIPVASMPSTTARPTLRVPGTGPPAIGGPAAAAPPAGAPAKLPRRAKATNAAAADGGDDDMRDVEDILRRRGIN
jgi:hypothetical protein